MGKRHTLLSKDFFKNSLYIKEIEKEYDIKDFKKEFKKQYDMIFDIYQTFITLNNRFFSDSNLSNLDKVSKATDILETLFELNENGNIVGVKYSVRDIKDICDKHCRYLYNQMGEWYECLYNLSPKNIDTSTLLKNVKLNIEKEMNLLELSNFDKIAINNISFQKNKIKNYKNYSMFLSKFDKIYNESEKFKEQYVKEFYDKNGIKLEKKDVNTLGLLFKLLSSLNNGLVKIINNYKVDTDISHSINIDELYQIYLSSFNVNYEDTKYIDNSKEFLKETGIIKNKIDEKISYNNNILIERFDLFFFYLTIEQCFYSHKIKVKSDYINKLLNDLIEIYKIFLEIQKIEKEMTLEAIKEKYFIPMYNKVSCLIERYGDIYEKIS